MNSFVLMKKTSFSRCIFCFLLISNFLLYSQAKTSQIIPPSPEASALFKYQDYPMDYSTGLPQINIPLYEVRSGSLGVPISLSYHASGRRVSDTDGPIAVGWSLNAGGMITRTVYGSADFGLFKFPYPFNINNLNPVNDIDLLKEITHWEFYRAPGHFKDSEYDVFSYSINNLSGRFIFSDVNNVKTPELIPKKPYVITPITDSIGLVGFYMTDDVGVSYYFTATEIANVYTQGYYTGYTLNRMISADKADTIFFDYTGFAQMRTSISKNYVLDDTPDTQGAGGVPFGYSIIPTESEGKEQIHYQISRLTKIRYKEGSVLFNLEPNGDKVDNIEIRNGNNETIKTFQLSRSQMTGVSDGDPPISKLNSIVTKGKDNISTGKHAFEYYPMVYPNGYSTMNYRHCDYWGYYNASGTLDMVPYNTGINYVDFGATSSIAVGRPATNRIPNLSALQSGVLKKITYPTGGFSEFIYENNKYLSLLTIPNQVKLGPGLRVAKILTNDGSALVKTREFRYGIAECDYTSIEIEPVLNHMFIQVNYKYLNCSSCLPAYFSPGDCSAFRRRIFSSEFNSELRDLASRPLIYKEVAEYNGSVGNDAGKTVYKYDYSPWGVGPMFFGLKHIPAYNYFDIPSLLTQSIYAKKNSQYKMVKEVSNGYTTTTLKNVEGLHVQRIWTIPQSGTQLCGDPVGSDAETFSLYNYTGVGGGLGPPQQVYSFSGYSIPVGFKNLTSTSETIFNDDGTSVTNATSYAYNSNQLLSSTSRSISGGGVIYQQVKYPFDYSGNSILSSMASPTLNMLNFPIEQIETRNSIPTKSTRYNYTNWGTTHARMAVQSIDNKIGVNPYKTDVRFLSYDERRNPTEVLKENDLKYTYIWDYHNTQPIAETENAVKNDIAFTSFEADGNGSWGNVLSSKIASSGKGLTGEYYYDLTGTSLTKEGLDEDKTYVVSYWSRGGGLTVSGAAKAGWPKNVKTVAVNGVTWSYWEHHVSGVSSISVSGSGVIDELRLYPENARMTTYTYEPLIGMTSKTDPNNITQYFEYDNAGRLKFTRDARWNIVKMWNYNQRNK